MPDEVLKLNEIGRLGVFPDFRPAETC